MGVNGKCEVYFGPLGNVFFVLKIMSSFWSGRRICLKYKASVVTFHTPTVFIQMYLWYCVLFW